MDVKCVMLSTEPSERTETSWNAKIRNISSIARQLATKKLTKRLFKTIKKASKVKYHVRKGVRDVTKYARWHNAQESPCLVIIAGDVSPLDIISHMPVLCEDKNIPYCYAPSKDDIGAACGSKRQACMVMVVAHKDYQDYFDKCISGISELPKSY